MNNLDKLEQQLEAREQTLRARQQRLDVLEARVQAFRAKKLELDRLEAKQNVREARLSAELTQLGETATPKKEDKAPEPIWNPFFFGMSELEREPETAPQIAAKRRVLERTVSVDARPPAAPKAPKRSKGDNSLAKGIAIGAVATIVGRGITNIPTLFIENQRLGLERDRLELAEHRRELTQRELNIAQDFAAREMDPAANILAKLYEKRFWFLTENNVWTDLPPTEQLRKLLADPNTGPVVRCLVAGLNAPETGKLCDSVSPSS